MGKGKTQLTEKWLTHEKYKSWVRKGLTVYRAKCCVCRREVNVENGVEDALKKHAKGKTHNEKMPKESDGSALRITDFLSSTTTSTTTSSATSSSSSPTLFSTSSSSSAFLSSALTPFLTGGDLVLKAEIKSALRVVKNHDSFNSCSDLGEHYRDIFPDSETASKFTFGKTKCMYLIKHGISPWVVESVINSFLSSPFFSVSFDDSHNKVLEMEQMDIQVRYWCPVRNIALTRYLGSQFQYSTTAEALLEELLNALPSSPELKNMTQLAMDGPSTNWKVLKLADEFRE